MTTDERIRWRAWQRERQRRYRAEHPEKCTRCGGPAAEGRTCCARCQAYWRERYVPGRSDTAAHAAMLEAARRPNARCALTRLTARVLAAVGVRLEVDRIDPRKGYTPGNMRLLASTLNRSKGNRREPCGTTVRALVARVRAVA